MLRAVRAAHIDSWTGEPNLWFMDYRNADGSIAQMCGNGLRLFIAYMVANGMDDGDPRVSVATRAGLRTGVVQPDSQVCVSMGSVRIDDDLTWIDLHGQRYTTVYKVDVGNPHAVVVCENPEDVDALDLTQAPVFDQQRFPEGTNIEFIAPSCDGLRMRVFERGVGETLSCGTGVVASAHVYAAHLSGSKPVHVEVPGGSLTVDIADGESYLTGPAQIVARGTCTII